MLTRRKYTKEEKLAIVKEFAKSGLGKCAFVKQHPEYKSGTLLKWLQLYFPAQETVPDSTEASDSTAVKSKDSIGKYEMVVETAKMSEEEIGVYCRSNGIYASELKLWKLNCMNANDTKKGTLEQELIRLRAEVRELKERDSRQSAELKNKDKELSRMKDALAEYAVKEAFLKKAQAFFGKNDEEQ
jgi:transposase-like protein